MLKSLLKAILPPIIQAFAEWATNAVKNLRTKKTSENGNS